MQKILFSILSFFIFLSVSFSQILDPVSWSFSVQQNGNEATLVSKAALDKGWHVYSQNLESEFGPVPTEFIYDKSDNYSLDGKTIETKKPTIQYDKNFDMNVAYFSDEIIFKQKIKVNSENDFVLKGSVGFMVCDDEKCLPPTDELFEFKLKGVEVGVEAIQDRKLVYEEENYELNPVITIKDLSEPIEISDLQESTGILDPIQWSFSSTKLNDTEYLITAKASIQDHWHVYSSVLESDDGPIPTKFMLEDSVKAEFFGDISEKGEKKREYDPNFLMNLDFYEKEVVFSQKIKLESKETSIVKGEIKFMTCNESTCIYPSGLFEIDLTKGSENTIRSNKSTANNTTLPELDKFDLNNPINDCGGESSSNETKSLWLIFLLGLGGGLFAILTPCVYPMIPLTVSFFTKGGEDKNKGLGKAGLYGLFILLIYVSLSIPFHVGNLDPQILNGIATNPVLNITFFVVFVFFAFSFLGYYELTLPSKWSNKSDSASNRGGFIGIFFMALTLALVSFSCTGPILGSVLAGVLKDGAWPLTAALAGFGLALGLPFTVFAAFPSLMKSIPQSGGWLNSVKVVLGFLELGLALKFLSNADLVMQWGLIKRELFFAIWILLGLGLTAYLLGLIKFPHDSKLKKLSFPRIGFAVLVLAFVVYLIPGLTCGDNANRRLVSGFPPPLFYSYCNQDNNCPLNLDCHKDFIEGQEIAKELGKPILLDFTGWACVNCREVEENIWPDPEVLKLISEEYVLISLYVDDLKELPKKEQGEVEIKYDNGKVKTKRIKTVGDKWFTFETLVFKNNSQPRYVLLSPDGQLLNNPISYKDIKENGYAKFYAEFLTCGLEAYEKIK
jgi:thiol:disulfide interchange protein